MRVLGFPVVTPDAVVQRVASDVGALARMARAAPRQLDRLLALGEEMVAIGHRVLDLGERIDQRAEAILAIGERIDERAEAMLTLGGRLDDAANGLLELGGSMRDMAERIDSRGAEIVERAGAVAQTGGELIGVIPTLERAMEMATPLEGAIDRFGRLVDRLPGGGAKRRAEAEAAASEIRDRQDRSTDPTAPQEADAEEQRS